MQVEPLHLSTLTCFCCGLLTAKHKCKLDIGKEIFLTVCLCDNCVKLEETELRMRFTATSGGTKTVKQAARVLGVSTCRVHQFVKGRRLFAEKIGRDLLITNENLEAFAKTERKTGRPVNRK